MSLALMRAARPLRMAPTDKAVLMALADAARDPDDPDNPCQCWPPMTGRDGKLGLTDITCLSDRAVQLALRRLVDEGHISRLEKNGRGVLYTVHPRTTFTPEGDSPPNDVHPEGGSGVHEVRGTPERRSPKAPITTIKKKRATPSPSTRCAFPMPDGVDPQHWQDLLANRRRKNLPNTPTAHTKMMRDLDRLADDDWPIPRLIQHAAEKGWAAIYDPRGSDRTSANLTRMGPAVDAGARFLARRGLQGSGNGLLDAVIDAERADRSPWERPSGPVEARRRARNVRGVETGPGDGGLDDPT